MPSLVKDTGIILNILSKLGPIPPNTILATLEVNYFYTNLPLSQAKQEVGRIHVRRRPGATEWSNLSLIRFLHLVYTKNSFTFSHGKKCTIICKQMDAAWAPNTHLTLPAPTWVNLKQHIYTDHQQTLPLFMIRRWRLLSLEPWRHSSPTFCRLSQKSRKQN